MTPAATETAEADDSPLPGDPLGLPHNWRAFLAGIAAQAAEARELAAAAVPEWRTVHGCTGPGRAA